jgi:MFS family permease
MSAPSEAALHDPYDSARATAERSADNSLGYYAWGASNVLLGALAMVGTLPGRTHGLGLVTEPLLADLHLDRDTFANINLFATLVGALACFPAGWLIDRLGTRWSYVLVVAALGAVCWVMSGVTGIVALTVLVTLTRAFGQSALSVVSMAVVGKWFRSRVGVAMSIYSILMGLGFGASFAAVGWAVRNQGWRTAWSEISLALMFGLAPLAALLVRSNPERYGQRHEPTSVAALAEAGFSFAAALRTPAFWIFALAASLYGLVASGMGLFNEAILRERGFNQETYHHVLSISFAIGLGGQFLAGALGWKFSLARILAGAMFVYAAALLWLPQVETMTQLYGYVLLMGIAGGIITVIFFAIWPQAFGRASLGRIQGAAQMLTVLASAVGPKVFTLCYRQYESYSPALYLLAPIVAALGLAAWFIRTPRPDERPV